MERVGSRDSQHEEEGNANTREGRYMEHQQGLPDQGGTWIGHKRGSIQQQPSLPSPDLSVCPELHSYAYRSAWNITRIQ